MQRPARARLAPALMLASGFAGLGYQIVWTQQAGLWLGHESAALLAVLVAFFGGLGLGALALGARLERSRVAARWYAGCELLIGLWGLLLMFAMTPVSAWLLAQMGAQPSPLRQGLLAFGGVFLLLLPATLAMGATLPALERVTAQLGAQGRSIAWLYACNTSGAVLGVLASTFWLVPALGFSRTAAVCVALNLLCAAVAWWGLPRDEPAAPAPQAPGPWQGTLLRLALTGLLGIGYEVLVVRVLGQLTEDTVYTYALLLAVYLAGTALGAAAWQRAQSGRAGARWHANRLLAALALSCLLGSAALWQAERIKTWLTPDAAAGVASALGIEALLALASFGLPTLVMGALFSQLSATAQGEGLGFGRALGANTLGAALAPLLFGLWLAPALGPKLALLLIPAGYLALAQRSAWQRPGPWAVAGATLALALWAPPLAFVDMPEGAHLVSYQEGALAAVSVVEDSQGVARLRINNRQQEGSSSSLLADARQALLPLLLHPAPQRALFLGLGTGLTAASAAEDPGLQVDAVELLPEVIKASRHFTQGLGDGSPNPRLHLLAADARRYVRASAQQYEVIVSDNFHPARSGSGALYTVEHFQAVRARLSPDGLFCQWLPLHQLDLDSLRSIVQAFLHAYPDGRALLASNSLQTPVLGLLGRANGRAGELSASQARERLAHARWPTPPAAFGIEDEYALLGSFIAGPRALARFAGTAAANSDDLPVVAHAAPRLVYADRQPARERLIELLQLLAPANTDADPPVVNDAEAARRLAAYALARQAYLEAGRAVRPSADVQAMLSQVQAPLLAVLRISADFRPAYDPLLRMAAALAPRDAAAAAGLLRALQQLQPARPEAGALLLQFEAPPGTRP